MLCRVCVPCLCRESVVLLFAGYGKDSSLLSAAVPIGALHQMMTVVTPGVTKLSCALGWELVSQQIAKRHSKVSKLASIHIFGCQNAFLPNVDLGVNGVLLKTSRGAFFQSYSYISSCSYFFKGGGFEEVCLVHLATT